jgi:hypothetical protein
MMTDLTQADLKRFLSYNPETGVFTWIKSNARRRASCKVAGTTSASGYWVIFINYKSYFAHRLAWLYMTGEWPSNQIDHRDANRLNNEWKNLRAATGSQNAKNKRPKPGHLIGAAWHQKVQKWIPTIRVNGEKVRLGTYDCPAAAHFAYVVAADKHHGEFARFS